MQFNLQALSKKAINAALNQEWELAVQLNEEILEKVPEEKDAKIRLGRAYLKTKNYSGAKKIFKQILEVDPINKIAQKNYQLATEKKDDVNTGKEISKINKAYIKEPGTSTQIEVKVIDKRSMRSIELGQSLNLRSYKTKTDVELDSGKEIGLLEGEMAKVLYDAKKQEKEVSAKVIKVKQDSIIVTLSCRQPIFKSEKQYEKPFMKMDLDEDSESEESESDVISAE